MDPKVALVNLIEALLTASDENLWDRVDALRDWMQAGGFGPTLNISAHYSGLLVQTNCGTVSTMVAWECMRKS